eukprot:6172996-Pleurochrysis_carterae.AAC.9
MTDGEGIIKSDRGFCARKARCSRSLRTDDGKAIMCMDSMGGDEGLIISVLSVVDDRFSGQ